VQVSKDSIDLGIVVTDEKAALSFYRDGLGLEWEGELPLPGGRMYRLKCGTTVIKLLKLDRTPTAKPAPGGPMGGLGYCDATNLLSCCLPPVTIRVNHGR